MVRPQLRKRLIYRFEFDSHHGVLALGADIFVYHVFTEQSISESNAFFWAYLVRFPWNCYKVIVLDLRKQYTFSFSPRLEI